MIKRRTRNILILILIIFTLVGIALFFFIRQVQSDFSEEITVEIHGTTTSVLTVDDLNLKPGEYREYAVNLKSDVDIEYTIDLDFVETDDGGLKNFINTEIKCLDETHTKALCDLLNGEDKITFKCPLQKDVVTQIVIRYYMPIETGNEAQGTAADFNVVLTASCRDLVKG
ncbi:MAG: hypothetical protein J6N93_01950 [Clostridia bacterium]|nr:hypothetical protein [Clostridia bacterium]